MLSAVCPELVRDNAVPTFEMPDAVREKADPVRDIADPVRDIAASAWAAREASEPVQEICLRSTG